jgi:Zn-dependent protease
MNEPRTDEESRRRMENLRAVLAGGPASTPKSVEGARRRGSANDAQTRTSDPSHRGRKAALGTLGALALFLAGKLKFLGILAGVLKFKTLGTMLLSVALYATEWGWAFAVGFVFLIFVHEFGHWVILHREGIPAGAPVFIPFIGAVIAMRGRPRDAYVEAKVAIGGPIAGSVAAWAALGAGLAVEEPLFVTLGHAGILLNLFNLIPVSPLDGGRIAGAFSRAFWIGGYALGVVALVVTRAPMLLLVLLVGLFTLWQRWRHPVPGYDAIPVDKRLTVGLGYVALVLALALTLPIGLEIHPSGR